LARGPSAGELAALFAVIWSVVINHDARPMISVAIPVDDDCLVPVGIAVTISVDNDRLIAIGASISIGMDVNAARPYTNANVISENGRYGANARDGAYNKLLFGS
jgi:hypothetical protein